MSRTPPAATIVEYERQEVLRANATGKQPAVFIHGLWLLPTSWDRWAELFESAGYVALAPGWPDDPETVDEAASDPAVFAHKSVGQVCDHYAEIIRLLDKKPAIVGHPFGGMIAQMLAGRALSAVTVAVAPAPFQGVLPLPISALRSAWPVLNNPANRKRAIPLTYEQFRYAFANAVTEDEARRLYEEYAVPASGLPLFEAATANLNPWSEVKVERNPERGPMLLIGADNDHTVPWAVVKAAYDIELRSGGGVTEIVKMPGRGHALTIDGGWREVADTALRFVQRFASV